MTPAHVKEIFDRLALLVVELDPNPSARGYLYLQDIIAKTRGYLNETAHYLGEVLREQHSLEMDLDAEEAAFEVHSDELLANDHRVKNLPNIDDRKAMINVLLGDDRRKIQGLKRRLKNVEHVSKAVRHRQKELDNTMSAIRLQRSLVETEVRTGSFYGDETVTSRGKPSQQDFDDEELKDIFASVEAEAAAPPQSDEAPEIETAVVADSAPESSPLDDDDELAALLSQDLPSGPRESVAVQAPPPVNAAPVPVQEEAAQAPAPQPIVAPATPKPKKAATTGEDPDIAKFLDGDYDFEGIFDSI